MKSARLVLCLLLHTTLLFSQLDTIHWLPPMHARQEWGPQYLYLSTPETEPFQVSIRDGSGQWLATATISNGQPFRYDLGSTNDTKTLVPQSQLHKPIPSKGLILDGPQKFYAYFRVHANSGHHAGDLTCKGRAALGQAFRIGHLLQEVDDGDRRSNFIGVLATEDSTVVTLSGFHPQVDFRVNGADQPVSGPVTVVLQRGESAVFSQYVSSSESSQPPNGLIGTLLESSKPVAVNCGSWVGAPVTFMAHDIGIDQIAPFEQLGEEYILCKGNGSSVLEHPIVIAHRDGTKVWLNGNAAPAATLDGGDYLVVETASFSAFGNLHIRSSEPVFVYQMIGGTAISDDAMRTAGLIFVPPISCGIPNAVDNIYEPNRIGAMSFQGGLMIVAMKDSTVTVSIDGAAIPLGAASGVPGAPDFVTYRNLTLFSQTGAPSTISVVAQGAVQVAMFGRNEPASFAAFYSGFSKTIVPTIDVALSGDGVCPDTLIATGLFDGVQWMYEDSILQYGADTFLIAYAPGLYTATGYLGVCRRTDYAQDTVSAGFSSPAFPYDAADPSCFAYSDGSIRFGQPYGGLEPYHYSIDNGQHFGTQNNIGGLTAGLYKLVVRDATGCYNRPLELTLDQPDSFSVELVQTRPKEIGKAGEAVELEALPACPVIASSWEPSAAAGCADCLTYTFRPEENTWVTVTVFDSAGCPAEDRLLVLVEPNMYVPNVIKPESSEGNDRFTLYSRAALPLRRLAIFDRWGELVFEKRDIFTNEPADGWDGRCRGREALPGVYVFVAEVEIQPGRTVFVRGDITLLR